MLEKKDTVLKVEGQTTVSGYKILDGPNILTLQLDWHETCQWRETVYQAANPSLKDGILHDMTHK